MRLTFAVEHTTNDGKTHKPDSSAEVPDEEARQILFTGHGRRADAPKKADKATTRKATKPTDKESEGE